MPSTSRVLAAARVSAGIGLRVARACSDAALRPGTAGVDRGDVTSTVDGIIQARVMPHGRARHGLSWRAELVRVHTPRRVDKDRLLALGLDVTEKADATSIEVVLAGVGLADVVADRGQTVDVGEACTRSARETKDRAVR